MNPITSFDELTLSDDLKQALQDISFTTPSPIQAQAIPFILAGRDVTGQAQTGTGKTAAFGIPAIEKIVLEDKSTQALILCPTRELALQVSEEMKRFAKYKRNLKIAAVYGGESIDRQIKALKMGAQIVVGTPGRIMDHIDRGTLRLDQVRMIILDEADEMLNMGFKEDIETILTEIPEEDRQTVFFSATLPTEIQKLTRSFQNNPEFVKVVNKELTVNNIEQLYFEIKPHLRVEAMSRLIDMHGLKLMLVFCNTKIGVDELVQELQAKNIMAEGIHGDLRQQQRNNVLAKFKSGIINILVATDVAARGIDVSGVDSVFNFDIPLDVEYYVHRIGRTGRAGKKGKSFTFVTGRKDTLRLRDIERYTKAEIKKTEVPNSKQISDFRKELFVEKIKNQINEQDLSAYQTVCEKLKTEGYSSHDVASSLLSMLIDLSDKTYQEVDFNLSGGAGRTDSRNSRSGDRDGGSRFERSERSSDRGDRYGRGDRDSSATRGDRGGDRGDRFGRERKTFSNDGPRSEQYPDTNMARLFLNLGKNDRIRPGDIVGAIASEANIDGKVIGSIEIKDKFSYVQVPKELVNQVITAMENNTIKGIRVNLEEAK